MTKIGGVALNEVKQWKFVEEEKGDSDVIAKFSQNVPTGMGLSHLILLKEVIETLINKKNEPIISAEESLNTTKLIHALYKSDEEKKWIDLKDL